MKRIICFLIGHKKEGKACLRCGCRFGVPHFRGGIPPPPPRREIKNHGDPNFRKTV